MELEQTLLPHLSVNISAKLITSLKILQLSSEELSQTISQEMADNPALEIEEQALCPICGAPLENGACPECHPAASATTSDDREVADVADYDASSYMETRDRRSQDGEEDYDPISLVASDMSLSEYLLAAMRNALPSEDMDIADYLVGSLDEFGYLTATDDEVAEALNVSPERVREVVAVLQRQDPIGVGARGPQECLLIQLRQLDEDGKGDELTRSILSTCFEELGEHKFDLIASRLHVKLPDVIEAWEFIKNNLTPFPAWSFWRDGQRVTAGRSGYVRPDVAIRPAEDGYVVDVLEAERYQLRINEFYPQLIREGADLSADDREFVRRCASRAKFFIDCIQQRWTTLRQITECLVDCQREFLDHGIRYLKPLTRSEVAFRVNLHESTVSRATANKYILLPNRRVIGFDDLFDGSLAIKDEIREIIEHEDRVHPLSDQEIAQLLQDKGIFLARRTVAKYRDAMHVLPSNLRTRMAAHQSLARV
ncbi:MAG: RNA polymerase factor sigma-54 [Chloroflexi bacterium]|nr:RNA polymerase factor sigma-54 [Chloroflexota bacterium]